MGEQGKWEEEARKEADILYITKPIKMAYIQGYLQACKVRQEEIGVLSSGAQIMAKVMKRDTEEMERLKELEPDALYLRRYREIRGKNPEIPCACVIDEDGKWLVKCAFHEGIVSDLELRLKKLVEAVEAIIDWVSEVQCADVGEIIKRLNKAISINLR